MEPDQGCLQIDSIDSCWIDWIDRFDSIDSCLLVVSAGYLGDVWGVSSVLGVFGGCPRVLIDRLDRFDSFDFIIDSIDFRCYCVYGGLALPRATWGV